MKFSSALITVISAASAASSMAFVAPKVSNVATRTTELQAESTNNNVLAKACATAALSALLWGSPTIVADQATTFANNMNIEASPMVTNPFAASAKDKASATGSRVNKDPESLLRLGLPINNKEVRFTL